MNLLNRDVSRYLRHWREIHYYLLYVARSVILFRHPFRVIWSYVTQTSPADRKVSLRNGWVIHLSGHPHDVVTVFVVFVRRDYGLIEAGSLVVDVGANIGVFSLYAAYHGARRVIAIEPGAECFRVLEDNIRQNGLGLVVMPYRAAVTGVAGERVPFPVSASMYNAVGATDDGSDYDMVDTTDLRDLLERLATVDLLKIDCEGCEYDTLLSASADVLRRIRCVRLEYHRARLNELEALFAQNGLVRTQLLEHSRMSGVAWFDRRAAIDSE